MFFLKQRNRNPLNAIKDYLLSVFSYKPHVSAPAEFDSRGGTVDYHTEASFGKKTLP